MNVMVVRSALLALLAFAGIGNAQADRKAHPEATITMIRNGSACVSLFVGIRPEGEVKVQYQGSGSRKQMHVYFRHSEVRTFPTPVHVDMTMVAHCQPAPPGVGLSPALPPFAKGLKFEFEWRLQDEARQLRTTKLVMPTNLADSTAVWMEGGQSRRLDFTIPADGIPVSSDLVVKVSDKHAVLKEIVLHL